MQFNSRHCFFSHRNFQYHWHFVTGQVYLAFSTGFLNRYWETIQRVIKMIVYIRLWVLLQYFATNKPAENCIDRMLTMSLNFISHFGLWYTVNEQYLQRNKHKYELVFDYLNWNCKRWRLTINLMHFFVIAKMWIFGLFFFLNKKRRSSSILNKFASIYENKTKKYAGRENNWLKHFIKRFKNTSYFLTTQMIQA